MYQPKVTTTNKKFRSIPQSRFPRGTISILTDSRIPLDGLAQMFNMTLEQDAIPRPRPPFTPYGNAFVGTCVGIGTFVKIVLGIPTYYEISMQVVSGCSQLYTRKDGGNWTLIARPATAPTTAPTAAAASGSGLGIGAYKYQVTFVTVGGGETTPGTEGTVTTTSGNQKVNLTAIPVGGQGVVKRKIYRTAVGGATGTEKLVATINDNTTTTYTDTTDDGSLGAAVPTSNGSYISYDLAAWVTFTQGAQLVSSTDTSDDRVYISNGVDNMSYYDIENNNIITYAGLATPGAPTTTASGGLTGSNYNQYYRISANNAGGESAASASQHAGISTARDFWGSGQSITIAWSSVAGATSYNIYTADQSGSEVYLATVAGLTFLDDGSQAVNPFKAAPNNDSSAGPILTSIINIDNQLYGIGDPTNTQYLWYSGQGLHFGDFSFNPQGGGYVGIDYGGNTVPRNVFPFHDGKGNPAPSVLTYGPAGRGKLLHIQFTTTTVGSTPLTYPNVYEASAQDGCPSFRGVALYNNNAYYCTGTAFKTTGTKPNVVNILATDTISDQILPDVQSLDLAAMNGYVSLEFLGKIYFFLPVGGAGTNSQVWVLDLTRGGLWILRWELATGDNIQHAWLYQDNNGITHFLILQNNVVLELDLLRQTTATQDAGTPFPTLLQSGAMVFDEGGIAQVASYFTYLKFLYPRGTINSNISGVVEDGTLQPIGSDQLVQPTENAPFIWGQLLFSNPDGSSVFSGDTGTQSGNQPGSINFLTVSSITRPIEIDEIVSEQTWQITTNLAGCDYLLSSATTTVYSIPRRYAGSQ